MIILHLSFRNTFLLIFMDGIIWCLAFALSYMKQDNWMGQDWPRMDGD